MKIKTSSFLASMGVIFLIIITLISLGLAHVLFSSIQEIQKNNNTLASLASELRQSSQNLTENIRLYGATCDTQFKEIYIDIINERSGNKVRSSTAKVAPSQKIRLLDLLLQYGITEEEFAHLEKANLLSDQLTLLEFKAMAILEAGCISPSQEEGVIYPLNAQEAISILFSEEYCDEASRIMHEIDLFIDKLTTRTKHAYEKVQKKFAKEIFIALICLVFTLCVAIFTFFFIHKRIVAPLEETTYFAKETAEGNLHSQISITRMDELGILRQALNTLIANLNNLDPLTGLYKFTKFVTETRTFIDNHPDMNLRMVFLDVDHFSYINETYGFDVGSKVLQHVAQHLRKYYPDISPLAHYDGDTFCIVHKKISKTSDELIQNLHLNELNKSLEAILGVHARLNFSIGVYDIVDRSLETTYMLDCAQIACNKSKETFGTRVEFYTEEMKREYVAQSQMLTYIKTALENKEFELYYQPQFDINSMHVVGTEALIRWFRNGKMIPPDTFIPIAEKHGLINELDYHVIDLACQFISIHKKECLPQISVNISGFTIIKNEIVEKLLEITQKYGVDPQEIDIEITETALVNNFEMAIKQVLALRELGFTISMDDFGTGVSSLNRLSQMPIDTIKLDRVFIINALENKKSSFIVRMIIDFAKNIDAKTVAEGIETQEQLELLRSLSCEHGQGYFYARPMSESNFLEYLAQIESNNLKYSNN